MRSDVQQALDYATTYSRTLEYSEDDPRLKLAVANAFLDFMLRRQEAERHVRAQPLNVAAQLPKRARAA